MKTWAVRLPQTQLGALGNLRQEAIEILSAGDELWLRGQQLEDSLRLRLRAISQAEGFDVWPDQQLCPWGRRVPVGRLPQGSWQRLSDWLTVAAPLAAWPGQLATRVPLKLVRSSVIEGASLLSTTLDDWAAYALSAAEVRLACWSFAVSATRRVLVRGQPLPSIAGERFSVSDGIALPLGWEWSPRVSSEVVRPLFGVGPDDLCVVSEDGQWECVRADDFVSATRVAIRATISRGLAPRCLRSEL